MRHGVSEAATVTAGTALGWVLYDLAVVAATPQPLLTLELFPSSLIAVGLAALVGLLWGLWPASRLLTLAAAAFVCGVAMVVAAPLPVVWLWFPRVLLLLILGASAAAWIAPRLRLSAAGTGVAFGAVSAVATAAYFGGMTRLSWLVITAAAFGLATSRLPRPGWRRLAALGAVAVPIAFVAPVAYERAQLRRPDRPLPAAAGERGRPNLLLIVLDTVRADRLAPYGYERVTTPRLDSFVRRCATVYKESYSTSSWTLPAHGSIFTGLYPSEHGAQRCRTGDPCGPAMSQPLRPDVPTLAERLAARGYQTAGISANAHYVAHELGFDRGFAHYDDRWGLNLKPMLLPQFAGFLPHVGRSIYRRADTITDLALDWTARRDPQRPFFLFLNYMDAHGPLLLEPPYDTAFSDEQPLNPYAPPPELHPLLYDRSLLFLDAQVSRLLHELEAQKVLEHTVVIITSDHGEGFGEHGAWWHGTTLYVEVLKVPLYVKGIGPCRNATSDARVSGIDVYHLALREVGLDDDVPRGRGADIMAELRVKPLTGAPNHVLLAWMEDGLKWIVSSSGSIEAYQLDADPKEKHPLAIDAEHIQRARDYAARWWADHPPVITARSRAYEIDAETRDRLRKLGY